MSAKEEQLKLMGLIPSERGAHSCTGAFNVAQPLPSTVVHERNNDWMKDIKPFLPRLFESRTPEEIAESKIQESSLLSKHMASALKNGEWKSLYTLKMSMPATPPQVNGLIANMKKAGVLEFRKGPHGEEVRLNKAKLLGKNEFVEFSEGRDYLDDPDGEDEFMKAVGNQIMQAVDDADRANDLKLKNRINDAWGKWDIGTLLRTKAINARQSSTLKAIRKRHTIPKAPAGFPRRISNRRESVEFSEALSIVSRVGKPTGLSKLKAGSKVKPSSVQHPVKQAHVRAVNLALRSKGLKLQGDVDSGWTVVSLKEPKRQRRRGRNDPDWNHDTPSLQDIGKNLGSYGESLDESGGHHTKIGDKWYADTAFMNNTSGVLPGFEMAHLGFGEFVLKGPDGEIEFDRMRGKDFKGQSGRSHQVYDNKKGALVKKLMKAMQSKGKSELAESAANEAVTRLAELGFLSEGWKRLNAKKVLAAKPTKIGQRAGVGFYEHPTRGDEAPLIVMKGGKAWQSDLRELPDHDEIASLAREMA